MGSYGAAGGQDDGFVHPDGDFDERTENATAELNRRMGPVRQTRRSCEEIAAYFVGLDLADPGLVLMPEWRALAHPATRSTATRVSAGGPSSEPGTPA